ncbi:MAG: hypothetical protein N3G22_03025 [Candidatus Micrarchaeota archaeon]|nr:hypothetical protein [Candidatus Micrarchaeota archaeon]
MSRPGQLLFLAFSLFLLTLLARPISAACAGQTCTDDYPASCCIDQQVCLREINVLMPCSTNNDCAEDQVCNSKAGYCETAEKYCGKCIDSETGHYVSCDENSDCCPGMICDINTFRCKVTNNLPPPAPAAPVINATNPPMNTMGKAHCTSNCPPAIIPADPETGQPASLSYRWYIDTTPVESWSDTPGVLDCEKIFCPVGKKITLRLRACDSANPPACSESVSNFLEVQPVGAICGDGVCEGGENSANCPNDCPPSCGNGICQSSLGETPTTCPADCVYSPPPSGGLGSFHIYFWAMLAILISATFLGLAHMAGKALENPMLEAWVKTELRELVASAIIAVFCVGMIETANAASTFLVGGTRTGSVIGDVQAFLRNSVYEDGKNLYMKLAEAYFHIARVASFGYTAGTNIYIIGISHSASPGSGLFPLLAQVGQAMDTVSSFMLLAAAQYAFLNFFGTAVAVMLPVGIFLRTFSFTRKIGGLVLAAAIASAVIYPASFFISKEIYNAYRADMGQHINAIHVRASSNPPLSSLVCNPFMQAFVLGPGGVGEIGWSVLICTPACIGATAGFLACFASCYKKVSDIYAYVEVAFRYLFAPVFEGYALATTGTDEGPYMDYYVAMRDHALPAVSKYIVLSLVVFLIPLIITMVLLRNFAITFGGEPQLYGLSKIL